MRHGPLSIDPDTFRALGHALVDRIADRLASVPDGPVTRDRTPAEVREAFGLDRPLPESGTSPAALLDGLVDRLFDYSLFNAHPRFFGYITAPPAPIGILGDLIASALNPNVGSWRLSPAATEIEAATLRWIADLVGYPTDAGGLLVTGGNMANFVCLFAARAAKAPWDIRADGVSAGRGRRLTLYCSAETHTWVQKAADLSGIGTSAIRWIPTDDRQRMRVDALAHQIDADTAAGDLPFLVIGTAGTVATGAVDPLRELATICRERGLWFHVDGAYGGFAAALPDAPADLRALSLADSVAVDPHKWLYAPLEAGCALVRDPERLRHAFSYHPSYYHFDEHPLNYVDFGMQNSRGFRALKVWLVLQQAGAAGYRESIATDIGLARRLASAVAAHAELELRTENLSITTFRFVPADLSRGDAGHAEDRRGGCRMEGAPSGAPQPPDSLRAGGSRGGAETAEGHSSHGGGQSAEAGAGADASTRAYLDALNERLVDTLQREGHAFVSNAVVDQVYVLRACIVNFHTTQADVDALPGIVVETGRRIDREMRRRRPGT